MGLFNFYNKKQEPVTPEPTRARFNKISDFQTSNSSLPVISESRKNGIVRFGSDNLYPLFLIDCYQSSPIHQSICYQKAQMTAGLGLTLINEIPQAKAFLDKIDIETLIRDLSLDYEIFGSMYLEVIWSLDHRGIIGLKRIDPTYMRLGTMCDDKITKFYFQRDWSKGEKDAVEMPAFSVNDPATNQVLMIKQNVPGLEYYSLPAYSASLQHIVIDKNISEYQKKNIENGFSAGFMVTFPNRGTEQEEEDIKNGLLKSFTGSKNAGKIIVSFADGIESIPQFTPLQVSDLDKQYMAVQDLIQSNILTGHRVTTPLLFGIKTTGQLGGSSELQDGYNIFFNTVIKPNQILIEKTINRILSINNYPTTISINEFNPLVRNTQGSPEPLTPGTKPEPTQNPDVQQ